MITGRAGELGVIWTIALDEIMGWLTKDFSLSVGRDRFICVLDQELNHI